MSDLTTVVPRSSAWAPRGAAKMAALSAAVGSCSSEGLAPAACSARGAAGAGHNEGDCQQGTRPPPADIKVDGDGRQGLVTYLVGFDQDARGAAGAGQHEGDGQQDTLFPPAYSAVDGDNRQALVTFLVDFDHDMWRADDAGEEGDVPAGSEENDGGPQGGLVRLVGSEAESGGQQGGLMCPEVSEEDDDKLDDLLLPGQSEEGDGSQEGL
mmetsp:Transcript_75318/g.207801  ORF Transcript_75318/g.207801 Transcript_75318/m.207801 type:complete len:211 (-) Transcript_75318:270-902(-)